MKKRIISILLSTIIALSAGAVCINAGAVTAQAATKSSSCAFATVKYGSRGSSVEELQTMLRYLSENYNKPAWNPGKVDGVFGGKTDSAVRAFQRDRHLKEDGICGPNTWNAMYDLVS